MALSLELAVVASDTGWRGRELRRGGDCFGGGDTTVARRELFVPGTGVLRAVDAPLGVFAVFIGVFARVAGVLCSLEVLPLGGSRLIPAGELDRVEVGLAAVEVVPIFLATTGNREDAAECGEGDCSARRRGAVSIRASSLWERA